MRASSGAVTQAFWSSTVVFDGARTLLDNGTAEGVALWALCAGLLVATMGWVMIPLREGAGAAVVLRLTALGSLLAAWVMRPHAGGASSTLSLGCMGLGVAMGLFASGNGNPDVPLAYGGALVKL